MPCPNCANREQVAFETAEGKMAGSDGWKVPSPPRARCLRRQISVLMTRGFSQVGVSLGSFTISETFLTALLKTFRAELDAKGADDKLDKKLDTDPHW